MSHDYPVIEADVVIVGGGSAGAMAGIRAKKMAGLIICIAPNHYVGNRIRFYGF